MAESRNRSMIGWVDRLDCRVRLLIALGAVVGVMTAAPGHWLELGLSSLAGLGLALWRGLSPWWLVRRLALVLVFGFFLILTVPFQVPGDRVVGLGSFVASRQGIALAASSAGKALVVLLWVLVMTAGLDASRLLGALHSLGIPRAVIMVLTLTHRFIAVLGGEWERMHEGLVSRTGRKGWRLWLPMAHLVKVLAVRTVERGERVHQAMLARGFDGAPVLAEPPSLERFDWIAGGVAFASLATMKLVGVFYG